MNPKFYIILVVSLLISMAYPQTLKHETRAAWIATVVNLDWPSSNLSSTAAQKQELISTLSELKDIGINVVIFQVRSESDAMYASEIEPWSYWLTGEQGTAPDPYYDPLEFAIEEAHKLGMELHAWFNPYRAERSAGSYTTSPQHVTNQHSEWIIQIGTIKVLDPGLPMVRGHVTKVIMDVINRYNVDGVHFDDYFYPYPPNQISDEDAGTFAEYSRGFTNLGDWRRDNVNLLVEAVFDSIQAVKPNVKFGISPFGIWKNGIPPGIVGLDAYNVIYGDAVAWLQNQIIDYLTPQLYWPFGGGQDYGKLLPWWAEVTGLYDRHLYPGQAAYRLDPNSGDWPRSEIVNQIELNRETENVYGSVFFRANQGLTDNLKGFANELKENIYAYPAIVPQMDWKEAQPPNPPNNLTFDTDSLEEFITLYWEIPDIAADGDSASRYVVYRFDEEPTGIEDLADATNILTLTGLKEFTPDVPDIDSDQFFYAVTALDQNNNESGMSNLVVLSAPSAPQLLLPQDLAINQRDTVLLVWNHVDKHINYNLQVATDSEFSDIIIEESALLDSLYVFTGLLGQATYYWRVNSSNAGGTGAYSEPFSFSTGFPPTPSLATPEHGTDEVPLETELVWFKTDAAKTYHVQLNRSDTFTNRLMDLDTTLEDTTIFIKDLYSFRIYYWRVSAQNDYGKSLWSEANAFRTIDVSTIEEDLSVPLTYELRQNYPNPFNPMTTIEYSIADPGYVSLKVYDLLGRLVANLIDQDQRSGRYQVTFDASNLPSGVYIYQLISNNHRFSCKMMLIK